MATPVEITLIGKPGCHLCEDAEVALEKVLGEFALAHPEVVVTVVRRNILEDQALAAKHADEIPVVLIDGKMHSYWRIDGARLLAKLGELAKA